MKKIIRTISLLLLFPIGVFAQTKEIALSKKEIRKERPTYIGITFGLNSSKYRDFATSPLFYSGTPKSWGLSRHRLDDKKETHIGLSYASGTYTNSFNSHIAPSSVKILSVYYSQLYQLNKFSSEKLNVKVGGLFNTTANLRINPSLQNNAGGIEVIPTLLGSIKLTKDISRKEAKNKKFIFIKYKLKKRTRNLAFNLNVGLLNSSLRNGYAYTGQSSILNTPKLFDRYEFKMFSGFRMSSAFDYTISLNNKNKIQLSYLWDAYKTGGDLDQFNMISHTFKITLLFNTNNK
mgnify:CR=1 FL=1|tara:strand:+ start:13784 stop:14656 length:873 start_codon:yes stop_codon:yes gene_type:complete